MNVYISTEDENKDLIPQIRGVRLSGHGKPVLQGERYDTLIYRLTSYSLYENLQPNVIAEMAAIIEKTDDTYHTDIPALKKLFKALVNAGASTSAH